MYILINAHSRAGCQERRAARFGVSGNILTLFIAFFSSVSKVVDDKLHKPLVYKHKVLQSCPNQCCSVACSLFLSLSFCVCVCVRIGVSGEPAPRHVIRSRVEMKPFGAVSDCSVHTYHLHV